MTNPSITREQLLAAIEAGIEAYNAPAEINEALREVGRTADTIAVGSYHGCGCPLTRAGVFPSDVYRAKWEDLLGEGPLKTRSKFADAFDASVVAAIGRREAAAWTGNDLAVIS